MKAAVDGTVTEEFRFPAGAPSDAARGSDAPDCAYRLVSTSEPETGPRQVVPL